MRKTVAELFIQHYGGNSVNGASNFYTPPTLHRYELKYLVPFTMVEPMCKFISAYCVLDKHSQNSPDRYYSVNSLYFDNPQLLFLERRLVGIDNRFNMRVRSYGEKSHPPYFLEIKQKSGDIIKKTRATIREDEWPCILTDPSFVAHDLDEKNLTRINTFTKTAHYYNAEPKILIQYRRNAWVSEYDDYARVTFDIDLKCRLEHLYQFDTREMVNFDHYPGFSSEGNVVLELKCYNTQVPIWMLDLIKSFQLHRTAFSKYLYGDSGN
jgi:SPX domain protein involved in polyphosphate accumulation